MRNIMTDKALIKEILGRDPVGPSEKSGEYIRGKKVLVTGAGGSIGAELCMRVAGLSPAELTLLDISENNVFDVLERLRTGFNDVAARPLIASVRDEERLDVIFESLRPDIVFHAAAHKHVNLMELHPGEAVKNNIEGTLFTARAASHFGAEKFVLISTDKAVDPVSVMGATKRVCELMMSSLDKEYDTCFTAVRFGNVFASRGSAVPLFLTQIQSGGPVTVTDKRMRRIFMSVDEAVELIIEAGDKSIGGDIFILDKGSMVSIDELVKVLIRHFRPEGCSDVNIIYTGAGSAEKTDEKLYYDFECARDTDTKEIKRIYPVAGKRDLNTGEWMRDVEKLCENVSSLCDEEIKTRLFELID